MKDISFIIPCYGSELTVKGVIEEIHSVMLEKRDISYEIIAVNDHSPDNVYNVLEELALSDLNLKILNFSRNFGKHSAIMAGYRLSKGNIVVNLDDDGQCPVDKIWDLIAPLENGHDIAIAKYPHKTQSTLKNFGSKLNELMAVVLINKPKTLSLSNFCAIKRYVVDEIIKYNNPYAYLDGLFLRTTSNVANVLMEERERTAGKGNYTFIKSLSLWLNGFTAFSVKPLRIATFTGMFCAFIGFLVGCIMIIRKFINPDIAAGYTSLIAVILFIGGLMMLMLGLIGEYIGRIYICINNSPQYVIRDKINVNEYMSSSDNVEYMRERNIL